MIIPQRSVLGRRATSSLAVLAEYESPWIFLQGQSGGRIEQFHDTAEHFNDRNFVSIEPSTELGFEFFELGRQFL